MSLPILIEQDNTATIEWCTKGAKFRRAKHILVAIHFVKDFVDKGTVVLRHCSAAKMHADMLTKPVAPKLFHDFVQVLFKVGSSLR